jgi:tRNA pseudouridine synthase 10
MSILAEARAVIEAGPVCDSCVGRVFADRSFGLSNVDRGRSLRIAVDLDDDEPYESVEPGDCWGCEGECGRFDEWADRAVEAIGDPEFGTYQVGTKTPPLIEENDELLRMDAGLEAERGELFKSNFNREVGKRIGQQTGTDVDFGRPDVQITLDIESDRVDTKINSAFIYGRYRKLERDIPQTEWPCRECHGSGRKGKRPCDHCDGEGYLYPESVEQLSAPVVMDVMDGTEATFHGAGREDVDALMLGTGRPFVIEIEVPHRRTVDTERLEGDINAFAEGKVEVEGLRLADYEMVERVKGLDASKTYRAQVEFDDAVASDELQASIAELDGATIEQYTPERVDHRRAGLTRVRDVLNASAELDDPKHATVEIHGEGGLYIKELVSGDDGRTEPSLAGLLGVEAVVTDLDVTAVEGVDEPFEREEFFLD